MFWQSQGGGPWGSGPRGGGPWSGNHGGGTPRGRGPQPPDFEELLRRGQDRFRRVLPKGGFGGGRRWIFLIPIAVVVLWLASGISTVDSDEVGVVLRFGAYNRTTGPGLSYHLPSPIEWVLKPSVTRVNRTEIGYRNAEGPRGGATRQVPEEALMLTGDENIVDINFTVFWVIKDAKAYLFNIRAPDATVKSAAESAMREVIGETQIAQALSEGRGKIETDTHGLLQGILNAYGAGIEVTQLQLQKVDPPGPVIDAFRDVQRALADREKLRNQAEAYRNDIVPKARGAAAAIKQEAEAYRQEIIARSQGDADRFTSVYHAFKAAQDVTLQRLYLETMEEVLKNSNKVIFDKSAQGGSGVLPYLPLPALGGANGTASAPAQGNVSGGSAPVTGTGQSSLPQSAAPPMPPL